jgi:chromosome segregation ATPase
MVVAAGVVIGLAGFAAAQGAPADQNAVLSALLAEVRAMRAEIAAATSSSIRAQLLIGRLQLQEQRMNNVSGQLAEVRRMLTGLQEGQGPMLVEFRRLEEAARGGSVSDPEQKAAAQMLEEMRSQVEQMQHQEQQLRAQESDLAAQLATEQGRWVDFNSRLDDIERSLTPR